MGAMPASDWSTVTPRTHYLVCVVSASRQTKEKTSILTGNDAKQRDWSVGSGLTQAETYYQSHVHGTGSSGVI